MMKHWKLGKIDRGYGPGIGTLLGDRVLSISKTPEGNIRFLEECDGYFSVELSREAAIEALNEAIEYIKE